MLKGPGDDIPAAIPGDLRHDATETCPHAAGLIEDSNKKFPLTAVNAEAIVHNTHELVPPGSELIEVAGPGGAGADVKFRTPDGRIVGVEAKSIQKVRDIDGQLSHAAQDQAPGGAVVIQVPEGTDVSNVLAKFWGQRKDLTGNPDDPGNKEKLEKYSNTTVMIVDDKGNILLEKQKIYQPR